METLTGYATSSITQSSDEEKTFGCGYLGAAAPSGHEAVWARGRLGTSSFGNIWAQRNWTKSKNNIMG